MAPPALAGGRGFAANAENYGPGGEARTEAGSTTR